MKLFSTIALCFLGALPALAGEENLEVFKDQVTICISVQLAVEPHNGETVDAGAYTSCEKPEEFYVDHNEFSCLVDRVAYFFQVRYTGQDVYLVEPQ